LNFEQKRYKIYLKATGRIDPLSIWVRSVYNNKAMRHTGKITDTNFILPKITGILIVILLIMSLITGLAGCKKSSRDSGSTVTGRALAFPAQNPVPFIRISLDGSGANRLHITDSDGSYMIPSVPTGSYALTMARFGHAIFTATVVIDQDAETYIVDLPNLSAGPSDIPGNIRDFAGPIEGAEIWIIYEDGGLTYAVSDIAGDFNFEDLPDGNVRVLVMAEDHEVEDIPGQYIGFEGIFRLDVVLDPITPVAGGIVRGNIYGQQGEILNEAFIGLFPNDTMPSIYMVAVAEALTDSNGFFELYDVPPGTYQAITISSGYTLFSNLLIVENQNEYSLNITMAKESY